MSLFARAILRIFFPYILLIFHLFQRWGSVGDRFSFCPADAGEELSCSLKRVGSDDPPPALALEQVALMTVKESGDYE